jgi:hypothetical protein
MADEIRVTPRADAAERTAAAGDVPTDAVRVEPATMPLPPEPDYDDPVDARADIEATRARMSDTIDEIEGALVRKKEEIRDRLDIVAPVRENPWPSMGIALGAGLVLGLLTGGGDDEDFAEDEDVERPARSRRSWGGAEWSHRVDVLEERTRRLLEIARKQEDELRRLRGKKGRKKAGREYLGPRLAHQVEEDVHDMETDPGGRLSGLRNVLADNLTSLLLQAVREFTRRR